MKAHEALKQVLAESGNTPATISLRVGKTRNYISALLAQAERTGGSLTCSTLSSLADACNYSLVLVPKGCEVAGAIPVEEVNPQQTDNANTKDSPDATCTKPATEQKHAASKESATEQRHAVSKKSTTKK